jgi:hypothetical protein
MLACLVNVKFALWKCGAYDGMLGQAEAVLGQAGYERPVLVRSVKPKPGTRVERSGFCWHAWASCGRVDGDVGPMNYPAPSELKQLGPTSRLRSKW